MTSIREKQAAAIRHMLNFNNSATKSSLAEPSWKVLIYDKWGQDIISPLLSVKDLRALGVTLYLQLHSERERIDDVSAVYFVMPTAENIKRIGFDLQDQMYESYFLNFISAINHKLLEDLALDAIKANATSQVSKIFDQYLRFISLEDDLFILQHQESRDLSYYAINKADVKDTEIEFIMNNLVDGLFSFCVTSGAIPIIRCQKGNAAEMVAEKLDKKLRDHLRDTMHTGQYSFQRPLLLLLDRNMDLATPFHHSWTYQALSHDTLSLQLNRIEFTEAEAVGTGPHATTKKTKKSYDMNTTDKFWQSHKGSPFPTVAEAVQEEIETIRTQKNEIERIKSVMGLEGGDDENDGLNVTENSALLTSAVSSLPELLSRKTLIDMHTNIATALLEEIKSRKLDTFFEYEEKLMGNVTLDKPIMEILKDPEIGTPEDKVRLFIINLICGPSMSDQHLDQFCSVLQDIGCDLSAINYIRRWKAYTKVISSAYSGGSTKTVSMFSKLMSTASTFTMEGVKNFVVKTHKLPVTKIVDALIENKSVPEVDEYLYFDPKLLRASDSKTIPRNKTPYQEAVVFMIGGGNFIEYQNLVDYSKNKASAVGSSKKIVYGCTELMNATEFLNQLTQLGNEMK